MQKNKKIAGKLITNKANIQYLSNFTGSSGFMLLTKKNKYLFTDFRYIERAINCIHPKIKIINTTKLWKNHEILKKEWNKIIKKHKINTLGIEENSITVQLLKKFKKITKIKQWEDISDEIQSLREKKTKEEIQYIKKSQKINEATYEKIKKIIHNALNKKKTIKEIDLAFEIKKISYEFGAEDIAFSPIVAFGKNSAIPHHQPGKTKLKKGEIILIDMGVKYKGYCSDMTRVLFTTPPTPLQNKIYNIVLEAQENAIKKIKAGISGKTADNYARKIIEKNGYGENYQHATGHGVGLEIHERPSLSENYAKKLKASSIITVEPGIYLKGKFGIRLEDMILVDENGSQNLTKIPKSQEFILVDR